MGGNVCLSLGLLRFEVAGKGKVGDVGQDPGVIELLREASDNLVIYCGGHGIRFRR